jgi:GDP-L-fucose synthase
MNNIWIPGSFGMLSRSICNVIDKKKYKLFKTSRKDLDLNFYSKVDYFIKKNNIEYIIMSAAKVGGINANNKYPVDFILKNLKIQNNILELSLKNNVKKVVFIGSSCIYPKSSPQPIKEKYLLTGELEQTNSAYAVAKIAGIELVKAINKQYNKNFISVMLTNLYGENDNFDLLNSHVVGALINKIVLAKSSGLEKVEVWGSGKPLRDILYVEDAARAILLCLEKYNSKEIINIGSGKEISIKNLAFLIAKIVKFNGKFFFNKDYPDGTLRKFLDIKKIKKLGWKPKYDLQKGLIKTINWYKNNL